MFRSAVFGQLGITKLEGAVTTDICGKKESHALRLDAEAQETIKSARLNRKVATAIFFESNGGQAKADATQPEIRLAVAEPGLDVGNIETALESGISPSFLVRNWPAMKEWQTQSVRDAFLASPKFPRLLSADAIRDTISRGVANGLLAYVGKTGSGD